MFADVSAKETVPSGATASLSRRALLARLGGGLGTLGLAQLLADPQMLMAAPGTTSSRGPHFAPRAKRVIQLFMNGGPFQADFFDPKPLLNKFAGQRPKEVDFRTENATGGLMAVPYPFQPRGQCGLPVSDLLPQLGECIDELCILRSLHCDNPNHGPALFQRNNCTITPTRPSMGALFLYGLGAEKSERPGYVFLCPRRPLRFSDRCTGGFGPGYRTAEGLAQRFVARPALGARDQRVVVALLHRRDHAVAGVGARDSLAVVQLQADGQRFLERGTRAGVIAHGHREAGEAGQRERPQRSG